MTPAAPVPQTDKSQRPRQADQANLFSTKEAAPRFELGVKDLQSSALPLGHAAGLG
jgi:hypothetical protein